MVQLKKLDTINKTLLAVSKFMGPRLRARILSIDQPLNYRRQFGGCWARVSLNERQSSRVRLTRMPRPTGSGIRTSVFGCDRVRFDVSLSVHLGEVQETGGAPDVQSQNQPPISGGRHAISRPGSGPPSTANVLPFSVSRRCYPGNLG